MHRTGRTIGRGAALAAAAALVLSACGSTGTSTSSATRSSPGSPTTPATGATRPSASPSATAVSFPIPNGTFVTTATRQEELAKGFSNKEIDQVYGPDGKLPYTLVLDNGTFHDVVEGDDGVKEVGATGTYTATKTQWVVTSTSPGCPGCVTTFRWSFDGKVLSLELVSDSAGPADFRNVRLVAEHDYVKVG